MELVQIADELQERTAPMRFSPPVTHVYHPLQYAAAPHRRYLERFGRGTKEVLLVGMNPGPWGMAQTGVPFGEVSLVRDWMGIEEPVGKPEEEHPKRPVQGFACERSEVSGRRLWGWARERFGAAEDFFRRFFVANYCPLVFMEESGRNRTPDKLRSEEREALFAPCDAALRRTVEVLDPHWVLGIGRFAEGRIQSVLSDYRAVLGALSHPSPANPAANRGWAAKIERELAELEIPL